MVILVHLAIKSYELVVALTGGGPGYATELPSTFMYAHTFTRNQLGMGAASAVMMLLTVAAVMVPYLYSEMRAGRRAIRSDGQARALMAQHWDSPQMRQAPACAGRRS